MYAPTNTSAPSPTAPGTRRISRPTVMQIASMSAMNVVPRMKPSTAPKARRAMASRCRPVPPRRERSAARPTARSESRRKKKIEQQREDGGGDHLADHAEPADHPGGGGAAELGEQVPGVGRRDRPARCPAAPKCSARSLAACLSEAMIWSPVSISAVTTMYAAPPTTATTAAQVSPAASDRFTFIRDQPPVQRPEQRRAEQREQHGRDGRLELDDTASTPTADDPGDQQHDHAPGRDPPHGLRE